MASSESNVGKEILFHSPTTTMSICDTTKSLYIKRFRPLMPKPPAAVSQTHFSAINAQRADFSMDAAPMDKQIPAQNRLLYIGLSSGREPGSGHGASPQAVSSRWNPTADQLRILEDLYARGIRTPSAEQIQYITVQLRCYGKIEGKNVFYWFQNHKARERQKRRRRMGMSAEDPLKSASETTSKQAYRPTHDTNVAWSAARTNPWPFSTSPHLEKTAFMQEPAAGKNFLKLAVPSADEEEDCRLNINCTSFSERDLNAKCTANKKDVVTLQQKLGMMNRQEDYSINLQNLQPVQDSHHQISTNWIRVLDSGDQADRRIFTSEQIWPRNCSQHSSTSMKTIHNGRVFAQYGDATTESTKTDHLQTLELFPLQSESARENPQRDSIQRPLEKSITSPCLQHIEPNTSTSLTCTPYHENRSNSTSPANGGFHEIKNDADMMISTRGDPDVQIYAMLDKHQQLPCPYFQFLPVLN